MTEENKPKLFLSYSRKDGLDFADQLSEALGLLGFSSLVDLKSIDPAEDWKARLHALILQCDTMVFIATPLALESEICRWEVAEATKNGKRIIPIVAKSIGFNVLPPEISKLNSIFFNTEPAVPRSGYGYGLRQLAEAVNTNLPWIREYSRLTELAVRWSNRGKADDLLLRGDEIDEAERWLQELPNDAPQPTELVADFIDRSRGTEVLEQRASELHRHGFLSAMQGIEQHINFAAKILDEENSDPSRKLDKPVAVLRRTLAIIDVERHNFLKVSFHEGARSSDDVISLIYHQVIQPSEVYARSALLAFDDTRAMQIRIADNVKNCALKLHGHAFDLQFVFKVIFENAIIYSKPKNDILIDVDLAEYQRGYLIVAVKDSGIGIEPELRAGMFTRWTRSVAARRHFSRGLGLGLWRARSVLRNYDGDLTQDELESATRMLVKMRIASAGQ